MNTITKNNNLNVEQGSFKRVLGPTSAFALCFGAMIGWSWVVLTGHWIELAGSLGAIIAFIIGGIVISLIGLCYAELTSAMPKTGGEHVYSYKALGWVRSFICTWAIVFGYISVVAFEAVALPSVIEYLFPNYSKIDLWRVAGFDVKLTWLIVSIIGSALITYINIIGITTSAFLQRIVTLFITIVGVMMISGALFIPTEQSIYESMSPLFNTKNTTIWTGIFAVMISVPFAFVGFDVIPQAAEEIDLPFKKIALWLMISIVSAILWYLLIIFAVGKGLDANQLVKSELATVDAMASIFNSPWAAKLLLLAGIAGILTSWNAFMIGGSRAIYAMAESGMLPKFLGKIHNKYNTPVNAILLIGLLSFIAPFFGKKTLVWIANAGSLGIAVAYMLVVLSFIVLRYKKPDMPRPFKVVYGKFIGFTTFIFACMLIMLYLPPSSVALIWPYEWALVLVWSLFGFILAFLTKRGKS